MDLIDEGSAFEIDGIMYENERFWNLRVDGVGITKCILEVERVSWVVERIKSRSNIYEGVEEYINVWVIERSRIRDRFYRGTSLVEVERSQ